MTVISKIINKYLRSHFEKRYKLSFVLLLNDSKSKLDSEISSILTEVCTRYHGLITNYHRRGRFREVEITVTCTSNEISRMKSEVSQKLKGYLI